MRNAGMSSAVRVILVATAVVASACGSSPGNSSIVGTAASQQPRSTTPQQQPQEQYPTLAQFLDSLPPGEFPASGLTPEEFERDVVAAGHLDGYRRFDESLFDVPSEVPFVVDPSPNDQPRRQPVVTGAKVLINDLLVVGFGVTGDANCWGITEPTVRIDRAKQEVRLDLEQRRRPEADYCTSSPGSTQYRMTIYIPGIQAGASVLDPTGKPLVDLTKITYYEDDGTLAKWGPDGVPVWGPSRERLRDVTLDLGLG